ncbi:MAG: ribosome biogenesis GTPase YlqF [Lachnospiraceae bacterium]
MDIQWYPGHMTKTIRMMQENIKLVDLVIEITDARAPDAGRNPDIDRLAQGKARLVILNKADLADPEASRLWMQKYQANGASALLMDARDRKNFRGIEEKITGICREKIERERAKGMRERPVRAMVAGIPNVGKSTFINSLTGKAMAKTGNKPGVTRGKQWIRVGKGVELLDTPGLLWPKFEDKRVGEKLAVLGTINDDILSTGELALLLIGLLREPYPGAIAGRYGFEDENIEPLAILEKIGEKRGCLRKGGSIDYDRAAGILLDDFRSGKLGRITLER